MTLNIKIFLWTFFSILGCDTFQARILIAPKLLQIDH